MHHPVSLSMGLSYLCGLLHNFGYLLMGQWFQPHWQYLEDIMITNPHCSWISLEQHALGLDHAALGGWLMEKWNMPIEVICSVKHHHDLHYDGPEIVYVWLIQVVDYLLGTLNMGENAQIQEMPERAFHGLGLTRARAMELLSELAPEQGELDTLVNRLIVKK
jgi:HD-like signal output (HDOD) protein